MTTKPRYALHYVDAKGAPADRPLYAVLRRAKVRGLGTISTYSLAEAGHPRITTWATLEAARRQAEKHSRVPEYARFEVVEYDSSVDA